MRRLRDGSGFVPSHLSTMLASRFEIGSMLRMRGRERRFDVTVDDMLGGKTFDRAYGGILLGTVPARLAPHWESIEPACAVGNANRRLQGLARGAESAPIWWNPPCSAIRPTLTFDRMHAPNPYNDPTAVQRGPSAPLRSRMKQAVAVLLAAATCASAVFAALQPRLPAWWGLLLAATVLILSFSAWRWRREEAYEPGRSSDTPADGADPRRATHGTRRSR